jgi:hypothetical protein
MATAGVMAEATVVADITIVTIMAATAAGKDLYTFLSTYTIYL